ncbi:MAG TPA: hypothetical protein VJV40_06305, partial [Thermodesulfobacteriota bacterium]|nr:hypothetical protein [Thermodesulfobacteriota bacterium]
MESAVSKFVFLNPPGLTEIALYLVLFAIVIYGSLRSTRHLRSVKRRVILTSLHALAFITVVLILMNPALRKESYREDKKTLAVVVDTSWSMNLSGEQDGGNRAESVRSFFSDNPGYFDKLGRNYTLDYYTFDDALRPSSRESLLRDKPSGRHTDFGKLISGLTEKQKRGELDEALIISDGGWSGDPGDALSVDSLKNTGLRISTVGALTADATDDIWIDKINSSEV